MKRIYAVHGIVECQEPGRTYTIELIVWVKAETARDAADDGFTQIAEAYPAVRWQHPPQVVEM